MIVNGLWSMMAQITEATVARPVKINQIREQGMFIFTSSSLLPRLLRSLVPIY
jgi:hypothetical protein